ncbi:hypothetical protein FACS1894125_0300 [Actinomycetota bacterium]|nr:hypothetical protein FACS1894125_0300 [Actinomycetota bacterium]
MVLVLACLAILFWTAAFALEQTQTKQIACPPSAQNDIRNGIYYNSVLNKTGCQPWVSDGETAGDFLGDETLKFFQITFKFDGVGNNIAYQAYNSDEGWQSEKKNGEVAGFSGKSASVEGLRIHLLDDTDEHIKLSYRVHLLTSGEWGKWVAEGDIAGTVDGDDVIDAYEIRLRMAPTNTTDSTLQDVDINDQDQDSSIQYVSTIKTIGDDTERENGITSGTVDRELPLTNLTVNLSSKTPGSVKYRLYIPSQNEWTQWVADGDNPMPIASDAAFSAVQVRLSGEIANTTNVLYRTHLNTAKWMEWQSNGLISGNYDANDFIDAVEIFLKPRVATDKVKIAMIGDSLTRGAMCYSTYGCENATDTEGDLLGSRYEMVNFGHSGATADGILADETIFEDIKDQNIKIAQIMLGTNNALSSNTARFKKDMQDIIKNLEDVGVEFIILNYAPYVKGQDSSVWQTNEMIVEDINPVVKQLAEEGRNVYLGDTTAYDFFEENTSGMYVIDGVHFSTKGYANLGKIWFEAYQKVLG